MRVFQYLQRLHGGVQTDGISATTPIPLEIAHELALYELGFVNHITGRV